MLKAKAMQDTCTLNSNNEQLRDAQLKNEHTFIPKCYKIIWNPKRSKQLYKGHAGGIFLFPFWDEFSHGDFPGLREEIPWEDAQDGRGRKKRATVSSTWIAQRGTWRLRHSPVTREASGPRSTTRTSVTAVQT